MSAQVQIAEVDSKLRDLAKGEYRTLTALAQMHERNFEASGLDEVTYDLVRMGALIAIGAPPVAWLTHLAAAKRHQLPTERILGTLIAVAPVAGTARTIAAGGHIAKALGVVDTVKERLDEREF